jgi:hypothetical protein
MELGWEEENERKMKVNNIEIQYICAGRGYNNMVLKDTE